MSAIEQQGHGHTADVDLPLIYEQMGDGTTELLRQLKIEKADFFGYSMGSAIALQIAISIRIGCANCGLISCLQ